MAATATRPQGREGRPGRLLLATAWLVFGVLALLSYRAELSSFRVAEELLLRFGRGDERSLQEGLRLASAGDLACSLAVDTVLSRASFPLETSDTDRDGRGGAPASSDSDQKAAARALMLRAVEARPGSAYHRLLLGRAASKGTATEREETSAREESWTVPLRLATAGAPGLDAAWTELALRYLQRWQELSSAEREAALRVIRRAALNEDFVSTGFALATTALGREGASSLLSNDQRALQSGAEALLRAQDLSGAAALLDRMERVVQKQCAADRMQIEGFFRRGDVEELRRACSRWATAGCAADPGDRQQLANAARVLEVWPDKPSGDWNTDPRARLLRFLLNGREDEVPGAAVAKTVGSLLGIPEYVRAELMLLARSLRAAEELGGRPELLGALEWTRYFAALARYHLREGRSAEASAAIDRIAAGALEECEVLLARRALARAQGNRFEVPLINERLEWLAERQQTRQSPEEARLSICADPERSARQSLVLRLSSATPAIVAYGWNGGRSGTLFFEGEHLLRIPLAGLSGRQSFSFQTLAGGPARLIGLSRGPNESAGVVLFDGAASGTDVADGLRWPLRRDVSPPIQGQRTSSISQIEGHE